MDLIQIANYAVIAILALSGFWILVGFLLGLWRGTAKSAIRSGTVILSALEAFLLTTPIVAWAANSYGDDLVAIVKNVIASSDPSTASLIDEAMTVSPTLAELIVKLPVALLTPIIFLSFFWLLSCINFIIYKIIAAIVLKKGAKKTGTSRLIGGAIGAVASVLVVFVILFPILGYVGTANDVLHEINAINAESGNTDESMVSIEEELLSPFCNQKLIKTVSDLGEKPFNMLLSFKINGEKVDLENEISYIFATVDTVGAFGSDLSSYGTEQSEAIRDIADNIDSSVLVPTILCEIIPSAASKWNNGEDFFGIAPIANSLPEDLSPIVTDLLVIFENLDRAGLKADLSTIADLFEVLAENGAFTVLANKADTNSLMELFSKEGFLSELLAALNDNEHFKPVLRGVTNLGIKAVGQALGLPENDEAVYNDIMADIADLINVSMECETADEKLAVMSDKLENVFDEYGIDVTPEEIDIISECIINDFGGIENITSEDVMNYFGEVDTSTLPSDLQVNNDEPAKDSDTEARVTLSALSAELLKTISAAAKLTGVENFEHSKATIEQMLITEEAMENLTTEEIIEDGQHIAEAITEINTFYKSLEESSDITGMDKIAALDLTALSNAVQSLNSTTLLGNVSAPLVSGALESMDLGLSGKTLEILTEGIANDKKGGEKEGYTANILSSMTVMTELVAKLSDTTLSKDELEATVKKLFENITPDTATLVGSAVTPGFIKKNVSGLDDDNASKISTVLSTLFNNMASETEMSDEEYRKEAGAISILLSLGLKVDKNNTSDLLNTVDENGNVIKEGTLGVDADYIIDTVLGSKIASKTIIDSAKTLGFDPFGAGKSLSEANKEAICNAINAKLAEESFSETDKEVAESICSIIGANVTIENGKATLID